MRVRANKQFECSAGVIDDDGWDARRRVHDIISNTITHGTRAHTHTLTLSTKPIIHLQHHITRLQRDNISSPSNLSISSDVDGAACAFAHIIVVIS